MKVPAVDSRLARRQITATKNRPDRLKDRIRNFWRSYGPWISPWQILQGVVAGILLGLAMLVPPRVASNAGSAVARTFGPLFHWHRRGMANLAHVYPDMSDAERRKLMDGVWDNLGRTMGEFARISKVGAAISVSGLEHVPPAGTPVIFVTAHMANWEALTWFSHHCGRELLNIYRRPNNVYVDRLLKLRSYGLPVQLVEKNNRGGMQLLRQLRKGGAITLFVDQKGTNGDVLVPFMGKDALTIRTPALLAAKTGATVIPGRMVRKNRHELHMVVCPPLPPITETGPEAERAYMKQINDVLTSWVEDTPEQWLWIHRRWKNADTQSVDAGATETSVETSDRQTSSVPR
jgi:KDO2-lipid IV(A) lauroyltransferase